MSVADLFIESTINRFQNEYLPRLKRALEVLPTEDLWWRPHPNTTSVGNLLCHLEGNVRQWILSGIGGQEDFRNRALEFSRLEGGSVEDLVSALETTVNAACDVIKNLDETGLMATYAIQGRSPSGVEAIYHVLEHFGWHLGQIVWAAKFRAGEQHQLAFYKSSELNTSRNG